MNNKYTCKVVYHTISESKPIKNIQLFRSFVDACQWAAIQEVRGFIPVSVVEDASIPDGFIHIGDSSKVHEGHYIARLV